MNKILISGAGGFLGSHLLAAIGQEDKVVALTSNPEQTRARLSGETKKVISNNEFFETPIDLKGFTLINLAYVRSSSEAVLKTNLEFSFRLFKKAVDSGIDRIINISSQSVYSDHRKSAAKETDLPESTTLYAIGKYYLENWIRDFSKQHEIDYVNLRIASLVGPHFEQRITSRLIKSALELHHISIDMNGKILSYTHVADVVQAILKTVELKENTFWNSTYNLGSQETYSLEKIAETIRQDLGRRNLDLLITKNNSNLNPENSAVDCTRFMDATSWSPEYDLSRIIQEEVDEQLRELGT